MSQNRVGVVSRVLGISLLKYVLFYFLSAAVVFRTLTPLNLDL